MAWSDGLFLVFALTTVLLLARWLDEPEVRATLPLWASAAAVAGTYTRYVGCTLYLLLIVALAVHGAWRGRLRGRKIWAPFGLALLLYPLLVSVLLIRNLRTASEIGGTRSTSYPGLSNTAFQMVRALVEGFIPIGNHLPPGPHDTLVTGAVSLTVWSIGLAAVTWVVVRSRRADAQGGPSRSQFPEWRKGSASLVLVFAIVYCGVLYLLRPVWRFGIDSRMLLPAAVCVALLGVTRLTLCLPNRRLFSIGAVWVFVTALATFVSLSVVDQVREDWRIFTGRPLLSRPIVPWIKRAIGTNRDGAPRVLTAGYLIAYLHFVTDGHPTVGLPALGDLATVLPDSATGATLIVTVPFGQGSSFPCAEYQRVYETLLTAVADSVSQGDGYTGWWLSPRRGRQARLADGAGRVRVAELCVNQSAETRGT